MLASAPIVAFVPTTDFDRSRAFYSGLLGLELVESTPYALVLRGGATIVRVTKVDDLTPQPFTVLGWIVDNIASALENLRAGGVPAELFAGMEQNSLGVWTTPAGDRIAWFKDPDGNVLSMTQPV